MPVKPNTGLVLGLALGGLAAVGGAACAIASRASRRGFAGPDEHGIVIIPGRVRKDGKIPVTFRYLSTGAKRVRLLTREQLDAEIARNRNRDSGDGSDEPIGFAGLGDAYTIKMFGPDGQLVGREELSLSKRDVVDVAKIKLHPTSPRVEIWKGHTSFSSTPTRWRTFKLSGGGQLGAFGAAEWLATSQYRYRASASERRNYGGSTVTDFFVYRREDRDDPKKWYKVRGYGPTPGERKTFAIRRAQEMAAQGVPTGNV